MMEDATPKSPNRKRRWAVALAAVALAAAAFAFLAVIAGTAASRTRLEAPAAAVLLRDRHGRFLSTAVPQGDADDALEADMGYWPLAEVPERVAAAMIAIEDRRFHSHPGVDVVAIVRALVQNVRSGERISGASTLAMQVARMQDPGPRTYARKLVEAVTALGLTARYGRDEVLRHYLRIVPYGNRARGIGFAARMYFDKPVADLSWAETAFLAAIPQTPARMNPFDPLGRLRAVERGRRILRRLADDGVLTDVELQVAEEQIVRLRVPPRSRRPDEAMHAVLRFETLLKDRDLEPGSDPIVATTLDLDLQREVTWMAWEAVRRWEGRGAGNAAVLVVDRQSWEVLAAVSSTDYFDDTYAGSIDYLRLPRSSGSTLKPFLYALALERGVITPATILDDLDRGAGGITNSDERFLGPLLPRVALANSRNVPAANLLGRLGVDEGFSFLGELGLHDGTESARRYGLGLSIGGLPVTLEELVRAYTVLAGDGRLRELRWFRENPPYPPFLKGGKEEAGRRLLSEETARLMTLFLADPNARLPTFPRMGWTEFPFAVAAKTGTSSRYRDAWTVAYSSRYLVGVWVGHPDVRPMRRLSGYRAASRLVHEILGYLHEDQLDGLEGLSFPPPRGFRPQRLCALSGRRATPACDRVVMERLPPGQEVLDACEVHRHVAIDRRNGRLATSAVPPGEVEVRSFAALDPRYAVWAAGAGLARPPLEASLLGTAASGPPRPARPNRIRVEPAPRLRVTSPPQGLRLLFDPETPAALNTLSLKAVVEPTPEEVVWYVDGRPFETVGYPFAVRWPLAVGEHAFEVRVPSSGGRSGKVRVVVE